jgi:hypothetical protein
MPSRSWKIGVTALLSSISAISHAAEWSIDPTVSVGAGYNDNVTMRIDDEVSSAEAFFRPAATFSVNTPTSGLSGNLAFDFRRFEDDSDLNDNNVRFTANTYRTTERSRFGLDLGLIKDTSLDSQLEETGLVFDRVDRLSKSISPNWIYGFSPRTSLELSYRYVDVGYSNTDETAFVDYSSHSASASLVRLLSEKLTVSATLSTTLSDNENDVESTYTYAQGGGSYRFSETVSGSLFAGVRRTKSEYTANSLIPIFSGDILIGFIPLSEDVSNSDWGSVFSGSINRKFLRGETELSASRDISNDISGALIQVTRIRLYNRYGFSETLDGALNLEFYRSEATNSVTTNLNRDYFVVSPSLTWNVEQFWRISASYRYRKQTYDDTNGDANQNAAYLTLVYRWPKIAVSR